METTAPAVPQKPAPVHLALPAVTSLLESAVADGVFPGAVALVGQRGEVVYCRSFGVRGLGGIDSKVGVAMETDTVFDLASLTMTVATATLAMKLVESGKMRLDDRVGRYLQGFGVHGKSAVTIRQLLTHTSGLAAWMPFFEELLREQAGARMGILTSRGARDYIYNSILRSQPKSQPGSRQVYSDVGFILLGFLAEALTGLPLDKAFLRLVAQPLGLKSTSFIDLSMIKRRGIHPVTDVIAPTEDCPWRKRVLCGEVHDDNAWAMGGVSGHSGLFSNARDLHVFAAEILKAFRGDGEFLQQETVREFWKQPRSEGDSLWRHGWDAPGRENGMNESGLSAQAGGINGFTGCSLGSSPSRDSI